MNELTSKQVRKLRAMGQRLDDAAAIGKAGLSDESAANVERLLDAHELIKVRLPGELEGSARKDFGRQLAEKVGAACVNIVGRTVLLYRPNESLPADKRVKLA